MKREEMAAVLQILHTEYRTEITPDLELLWWNAHQSKDVSVMVEAAKTWIVSQKWFPHTSEIEETVRKVQANRRRQWPATARCGGSGWVETGERSSTPCEACNPALAAVFADPTSFGKYRDGKPLSDISEQVMRQNGVMHAVDGMPAPCRVATIDDPYDPVRRRPVPDVGTAL